MRDPDEGFEGFVALFELSSSAPKPALGINLEVAKVSMLNGKYAKDELYLNNHKLHKRHDGRFGYKHFLLTRPIIGGFWDRTLYMMSLITQELAKPEDDRIQWLMWYDADTTLMNPKLPLEAFLPPEDQWSHIHMVVTNDKNGLNNGVFFLRVHPWSIKLLKTVLGIDSYEADVDLEYSEQTAMELWILSDTFRKHVMHAPQRWFNAYSNEWGFREVSGHVEAVKTVKDMDSSTIRQGDLLVHLAGGSNKERIMSRFLSIAQEHRSEWEVEYEGSALQAEIEHFWNEEALDEERNANKLVRAMQERRDFRKEHGMHKEG
ncbi:Hypothetical protein D9617_27g044670 [Elsinoe fawcettii]|nr:Hypothetical protein D9617_27g044670 [Elsinoe fawcettii]